MTETERKVLDLFNEYARLRRARADLRRRIDAIDEAAAVLSRDRAALQAEHDALGRSDCDWGRRFDDLVMAEGVAR